MATPNISHPESSHSGHRLPISADYLAIAIGLALVALVRFGVLHQIGF